MSVINQMLKDLEKRPAEPNSTSVLSSHNTLAYSPKKIAVISGFCVFLTCIISFYMWQLISENNALKADKASYRLSHQVSKQVPNRVATPEVSPTKNKITAPVSTEIHEQLSQPARPVQKADVIEHTALDQTPSNNSTVNNSQLEKRAIENKVKAKPVVNNNVGRVPSGIKPREPVDDHSHTGPDSGHNHEIVNTVKAKPVVNNNVGRVPSGIKPREAVDDHSHTGPDSGHNHDIANTVKANANKMSVSRRQLSADELVDQKLALAEKALAAKQINKAEKLLEDVVIIRPSDSQTRKKLAALWFGRQAYQDAVNILSQGISLNGQDSSLREMKARILLKLGRFTAALNTLKPLANLKNEQYQVMLANTAQQAQQNKVAVAAYNMLIVMQPDQGRWQLGLAVLYDKNSQFNLASSAYKKALTKNDLSLSSENFIKQRIEVIGQ